MTQMLRIRSKFLSYLLMDYPKSSLRRALTPFLLGLLLSTAFPPRSYIILGFISLLLFYRHFEKTLECASKGFFSVGYWYGFGYFAGGLYWIAYALHIDWVKYGVLIPLAALGIPAALALGLGTATFIASRLRSLGRLLPLLAFIVSWSLFEWVKGHMLSGFPWLNLAEIWLGGQTVIQNLAFVGPYGLGLLTLVLFVLLYGVIFFGKASRPSYLGCFFLLSASLLINGSVHLSKEPQRFYTDFDLVLVQPNILQIHKWDNDRLRSNIETHLRLSQQGRLLPQVGTTYKPKLFIWPEASVPYLVDSKSPFAKYVSQILQEGDYLILGGPRRNEEKGAHYNSLSILNHQGEVVGIYDKAHLVPYGEYVPYREFLPESLEKLSPGEHDYTAGEGLKTLSIKGFPSFSPLICYEAIFTQEVIQEGDVTSNQKRPSWMLNLTNDGWYLDSAGIYQHLQLTRMRAIEEGIPLVRVVYKGVSAVFDGNGRLSAQIPFDQAQGLVTQLPQPLKMKTFYSLHGQKIYALILLVLSVFMILLGLYTLKIRRNEVYL
ncbi:MAG TPA: apolipoprotein N-acyltransferase [Holosporales bacterium]|nr:apolipoprotein N-acyltransferase [Holosporales bacterium]